MGAMKKHAHRRREKRTDDNRRGEARKARRPVPAPLPPPALIRDPALPRLPVSQFRGPGEILPDPAVVTGPAPKAPSPYLQAKLPRADWEELRTLVRARPEQGPAELVRAAIVSLRMHPLRGV